MCLLYIIIIELSIFYFIFCFKKFKLSLSIFLCICTIIPMYFGIRLTNWMPIISVARILYFPIVLSFFLYYLRHKDAAGVYFPFHLIFIMIIFSSALSLLSASDISKAVNHIFKLIIEYYLLSFMIYFSFKDDNEGIKWIFNLLLFILLLTSLYSFYEGYLGYNPLSKLQLKNTAAQIEFYTDVRLFGRRVNSVFMRPQAFASYLVLTMSITAFNILEKILLSDSQLFTANLVKNVFLFMVSGIALLMAGVRGCWIAAAGGLFLIFLFSFKSQFVPKYVFVTLLLIAIFLPFRRCFKPVLDSFHGTKNFQNIAERIDLLHNFSWIIKKGGFWGIGSKNYDMGNPLVAKEIGLFSVRISANSSLRVGRDLCNHFICIALEEGVLGLIFHLIFQGVIVYGLFSRAYKTNSHTMRLLLTCAIFGIFFPYMFILVSQGEQYMMQHFIIIISLVVRYADNEEKTGSKMGLEINP